MRETTCLGAAMAAGLASGIWKNVEELKRINREDYAVFNPEISESDSDYLYKRWEKAVEMSRGWTESAKFA